MPTTRPVFLPNVQILRLLTGLMVVYGHVLHEMSELFNVPPATDPLALMNRIDIFFVLSGFATLYASRQHFGLDGEGRRFMVRRFLRLVPLYWLFTGLMVVALFAFSGQLAHTQFDIKHLLASLSFIPWPNQDGQLQPILILGWTLNYEMLFCVFFALALMLPGRVGIAMLIGVFMAAAALYPFIPEHLWILKYWSDPVILEFPIGMGLAMLYFRGFRLTPLQGTLIALAGFALLLAVTAWPDRPLSMRFIWAGIPALMVCAGFALSPQPTTQHWLYKSVVKTAAAGYVLYLAHPFAINIVVLFWQKVGIGSVELFIPAAMAASLALAIAGHRWLEKPLNKWLGKRSKGKREPATSRPAPFQPAE